MEIDICDGYRQPDNDLFPHTYPGFRAEEQTAAAGELTFTELPHQGVLGGGGSLLLALMPRHNSHMSSLMFAIIDLVRRQIKRKKKRKMDPCF